MNLIEDRDTQLAVVLFEVPADFQGLKATDIELAKEWRLYSRTMFEQFFHQGYLTTEVVYLPGTNPRCYYVLSQDDQTLGD
jgi:predicted GNAT superfamily acetyltransferase